MMNIRKKSKFSLFVLAIILLAQQICDAQDDLPFDVFGDSVDSREVFRYLELQGKKLTTSQADDAVEQLGKQLASVGSRSKIDLKSLVNAGAATKEKLYRHMVKSSLYLGELYNCGRCERTHPGSSGGVVVSEDGLALTNYHVLQAHHGDRTEGFMAMTYDGKCFAIDEIVAANQAADIALVRLKADGHKFHAAPIASKRPNPMDTVRVVSNPRGQFFLLTNGEVSRYSREKGKAMLEITADFGGGSSGSGIFNDRGEVVGVVSLITPIFGSMKATNGKNGTTKFVEMVLKRCVPLQGIHNCFEKHD